MVDLMTFFRADSTPAILLLVLCLVVAVVSIVCIVLLGRVRAKLEQSATQAAVLHRDLEQTNMLLETLVGDLGAYTGVRSTPERSEPSDPFDEVARRLERLS